MTSNLRMIRPLWARFLWCAVGLFREGRAPTRGGIVTSGGTGAVAVGDDIAWNLFLGGDDAARNCRAAFWRQGLC